MSIFDNAPTKSWLDVPIKAEGSAIGDSFVYNTAKARSYTAMSPLIIQEGDKTIVVSDMLMRLEYILQRTVPNYDELVEQYNAIKDIERSNNEY